MHVQLHAYEPASLANGPGLRAVLWVQGCSLGCPGCFNPGTHDPAKGEAVPVDLLARRMLDNRHPASGLTLSGGEPFQQPEAILALLERLKPRPLSILCFSGYTLAEIKAQPLGPAILDHLDVLVAGRYIQTQPAPAGLLGSANQRIHLLTSRHTMAEINAVPPREVILHKDGTMTRSGIRNG